MHKDSYYRKIYESSEERVNLGYDYSKRGFLSKLVSPMLFGNPRLAEFLRRTEMMLLELTDSVKTVQFFYNYTIDKNDRRYNF
jgi:hypothetical protein